MLVAFSLLVAQIKEVRECVRICDVHVVRGQDPHPGAAVKCIPQVWEDDVETGRHDETHDQVDAVKRRLLQAPQQLAPEPLIRNRCIEEVGSV